MFVVPLIFAAAAMSAPVSEVFMERIANVGLGRTKSVTAGALPAGWTPPAPLPQSVPILGTVVVPHFETQIYYQPADSSAAAQAYVAQLRTAGYVPKLGLPGHSGFSGAFMENLTVMCRDTTGVSILTPAKDDLRVTFVDSPLTGACAPHPPRFTSPVPDLYPPAGASLLRSIGGGTGISYGVVDGNSSYSSAMFGTSLTPKALLAGFASQMQAAHWQAQPAFTAPQGAAQSFRYDAGTSHWRATILLFAGRQPHTFEARLDASGTPETVVTVPAGPRPVAHLPKSQWPAALDLAQRVADASVYVRRVPPGFDKAIPTPAGSLIGSTLSQDGTALYYDLTRAQYDSYLTALHTGGWIAMPAFPRAGGFVTMRTNPGTSFCKVGAPLLYTSVTPNTNEFTLRISSGVPPHECKPQDFGPMSMMQGAPVPLFRAPAGTAMRPGSAGIIGGQSAATITGARSLNDVLSALASQLTAAQWVATPALANDAIGSQSFTYDQNGAKWQAVVTVYRSQQDSKTYYAFIDATRL